MQIVYSEHAKKRMNQRGISPLEIEQVLSQPSYVKKSFEGRKEAVGIVKGRELKIKFIETESHIKVITII